MSRFVKLPDLTVYLADVPAFPPSTPKTSNTRSRSFRAPSESGAHLQSWSSTVSVGDGFVTTITEERKGGC